MKEFAPKGSKFFQLKVPLLKRDPNNREAKSVLPEWVFFEKGDKIFILECFPLDVYAFTLSFSTELRNSKHFKTK